jgi:exopolysaccharide biosynthesis polyprenyl glycosylphosphotransferase
MTSPRRATGTRLDERNVLDAPLRGDFVFPSDDPPAITPTPQLIDASPSAGSAAVSGNLRALLVAIDVAGAVVAWTAALVLLHPSETPGEEAFGTRMGIALALVVVTVALIAREHLYLSRVCQVRAHEIGGLVRVGVVCAAAALVVGETLNVALHPGTAFAGGLCVVVVLAVLRGGYRTWLRACRGRGQCTRDIVVVGTNEEALDLSRLFIEQPEIGYRVVGAFGSEEEWRAHATPVPWLGPTDAAAGALRRSGSGAVVVASGLSSGALNRAVHELVGQHTHVFVSTGIRNVGHDRLRAVPLCHEPFFYVEEHSPTRLQAAAKRTFDLVTASALLVLALPVLVCAAAAIKLGDRGPVLFRQQRVGLGGARFEMLKLRTMVADASEQLSAIAGSNERRDGPLFKVTDDPRVTRAGRFLRATSIDELPQLVNVLRGEMSLVGPRPALPAEVAAFDDELLARLNVRPGITGLWQVEGRDNPSFHVYRRLDLYYVENWSISLDAAILWTTATSIMGRLFATIAALVPRKLQRRAGPTRTTPAGYLPTEVVAPCVPGTADSVVSSSANGSAAPVTRPRSL